MSRNLHADRRPFDPEGLVTGPPSLPVCFYLTMLEVGFYLLSSGGGRWFRPPSRPPTFRIFALHYVQCDDEAFIGGKKKFVWLFGAAVYLWASLVS